MRAAVLTTAMVLSSCSLVTPLGGLSGAADDAGGLAPDAGSPREAAGGDSGRDSGVDAAPATRAWRQINAVGPPARNSARMAYDATRSRVVLFGGATASSGSLAETWEWDGAAWTRRTLTTSPSARRSPGFVFDSARHVVVVFAGLEGAASEAWEWDGGPSWRSTGVTTTRPPIRNGAAMAYDSERNVIVVFGGQNPNTSSPGAETWEWSATGGFVKKTPATSPPARRGHVMAYDEARKRVVVFAGSGSNNDALGDLWEWDGTTWTQRSAPLAPAPRIAPCAAYDSARRVLVIFGGRRKGGGSLDDAWEWNGDTWSMGPAGPPARRTCAFAFDGARNVLIMYGGTSDRVGDVAQVLGDTWLYE